MKITETELEAARHYLQQQLETHSWWPKEQPGEANHEFTLMKDNAISLNVWCERSLDSGQKRLLEKALNSKPPLGNEHGGLPE
jgi:hypothetical protein